MLSEVPMGVVVIAPHRRLLERAVHPLHLAVSPRMIRLGEAMLDAVFTTDALEHMQSIACCWTSAP
jgi:hypothetical protein